MSRPQLSASTSCGKQGPHRFVIIHMHDQCRLHAAWVHRLAAPTGRSSSSVTAGPRPTAAVHWQCSCGWAGASSWRGLHGCGPNRVRTETVMAVRRFTKLRLLLAVRLSVVILMVPRVASWVAWAVGLQWTACRQDIYSCIRSIYIARIACWALVNRARVQCMYCASWSRIACITCMHARPAYALSPVHLRSRHGCLA